MLGRYSIVRGTPASELPEGEREDTRMHTRHILRPERAEVERFLADASDPAAWTRFATAYRTLLAARFAADREAFDALAARARVADVLLGCNCPTAKNPNVRHCHTALAMEFMAERYPDLEVIRPRSD
jgi:hypothetical protein